MSSVKIHSLFTLLKAIMPWIWIAVGLVFSGCRQDEMEQPIPEPEATVKIQVRATTLQRPLRSETLRENTGAPLNTEAEVGDSSSSIATEATENLPCTTTVSRGR